jgi:KDO2-lipid IV(A) lauroyltransferase
MKMSHGVEFAAFWLLTRLVQIMPAAVADKIAAGLGWLTYQLLKSRRAIAGDNLRRAFKEGISEAEIDRIVRVVFKNIARDIIEFARQPLIGLKKVDQYVTAHRGREYIDQVLAEGRGLMFVTGHIGNGELLGGWLAKYYPIDFVTGIQHNPYVNKMFNSFRDVFGAGIIPVGVAARHALKSFKENKIVILMSDQHSATGGVVVDFFGRPASTPKGPAAFAVKAGCPIIFGVLFRERYDRYTAVINPPIYPPQTGDREEDIKWMTQEYTSQLEAFIRQRPDQWMWTHRRWKLD